jgi:GT2 family glycosyltransferase
MKVSIVIPVHNNVKYTKRCIDSIRRTTKPDLYELVIVDNGSDEETKKFLLTLDAVVITNETNKGFAKAINDGFTQCSGSYYFILNNDTVVYPGWLERMVTAFDDTTGAVGPLSNYVMGKQRVVIGRKEAAPEQIHNIVSAQNKGQTSEAEFLIGFALMISRTAVEKVGLLDERFFAGSDDLDYSLRLRRAGYKLKIAEDVFVYHAGHRTSHNLLGKSDEFFEQANAEFFKKWSEELGTEIKSHRQAFEVALGLPGPNLTISTIVRNETSLLQGMIKKTNSFCDDYVIVDTGSTDGSLDRLRRLLLNNGTVLEHQWSDHYSESRNSGLDWVKGKWVLQLDADERIDVRHTRLMKHLLEREDVDAYRFKIINFRESPFLVEEPKQDVFTAIRMWRNSPEIRYKGIIHETVTDSILEAKYRIAESPVPILHFAYLKPAGRHFELMKRAVREEPRRGNTHYLLGEEYISRGDLKKAINCFANALACNTVKFNNRSFANPVQQMLEITEAVTKGEEIDSFPEDVRQHFKFLTGK